MRPAPDKHFCHIHLHLGKQQTQRPQQQQEQEYVGGRGKAGSDNSGDRERVPCPVDPNHSVYKDTLFRHLKICNSANHMRHLRQAGYYERDINLVDSRTGSDSNGFQAQDLMDTDVDTFVRRYLESLDKAKAAQVQVSPHKECDRQERLDGARITGGTFAGRMLQDVSQEQFDDLIARIDKAFEATCIEEEDEHEVKNDDHENSKTVIEKSVLCPNFCKSFFDHSDTMVQKVKHIHQQASIIGHIEQHGLLDSENTFVEWGCGSAELSLMLLRALLNKICPPELDEHSALDLLLPSFLLVDRAAQRRKMDTKIKMALIDVLRQKHSDKQRRKVEESVNATTTTTTTMMMMDEPGGCDAPVSTSQSQQQQHQVQQMLKKKKDKNVRSRRNRLSFEDDERLHVTSERLLIDIKDLAFDRAPLIRPLFEQASDSSTDTDLRRRIVNISKHLCGVATDLTLRCLHSAGKRATQMDDHVESCAPSLRRMGGIFIALCCHHRCTWKSYVNQKFFTDLGFNENDFDKIRMLSSWAICYTDDIIERHNDDERYLSFGRNIRDK